MRLSLVLLGLVVAAALLLLAAVFVVPATEQVVVHPDHPTLLRGADGAARIAPVALLGAAFGLVQIGFFGACFALGMRRRGSLGPVARPLWIGLALYAGVFLALLAAYRVFLDDPARLLLGFPLPTAVMLYALWPVPLWFLWLYLRHFDEQVLAPEDVERVRRIAREVAAEEGRE
ncbi:MAG: hypothetical protein ACQGVC_06945 [Myxococcota bacterium]